MSTDQVVWRPAAEVAQRARLSEFLALCGMESYDSLWQRSVVDVAWFTEQVLHFLGIQCDPPYKQVLDLAAGKPWARWCVGGGLNITEFCLDRHLAGDRRDAPAVVWEGEEPGATRQLTYAELHRAVELCAAGLRLLGVQRGDPVAIYLPMIPETVTALLAVGRVGAVAVPVFSGYGEQAIAARLADVEAKVLITCDAFPLRGTVVATKATADRAVKSCPTVEHIVVVRRLGVDAPMSQGRDCAWDKLLESGARAAADLRALEPTSAEDTLIVLYTSGTTGRPKGVQHAHCGFPVKAAQDMAFGTDVGRGTRITWVTDLGWMMGPWLIYGATLLGATVVLCDGAFDYPASDRLWSICARQQVNVLGISPTLVRSLANRGDDLPRRHDLSELRIFASTGEPWNPDPWWWLFDIVGRRERPIINYSGGTEISGGILMGNPLLPLKPCSFPAPCPGMAADILDEEGQAAPAGAVGELVIREPWIGMARGFWKDPERYLQTYWSRWPEVWVHGDWAVRDEDGHWSILGRSDDTLKVAGKRVGPAEVESVLVSHHEVAEAAVIGVPDPVKGTVMIAFCVPTCAAQTDAAELGEALRALVGLELGKPLRPAKVLFVTALPKTRNAKVMRRVLRAAYLGEDAGDLSALENPHSVEEIKKVTSDQ